MTAHPREQPAVARPAVRRASGRHLCVNLVWLAVKLSIAAFVILFALPFAMHQVLSSSVATIHYVGPTPAATSGPVAP